MCAEPAPRRRDVMLDAAVSRPWLLSYTRCDLTFLCPALARLTSFRKACLCSDLQCLCGIVLAKEGGLQAVLCAAGGDRQGDVDPC
jgi:hypothetical protein